ncbi:capsular exopolysaccharide family [Blastococcus aurantiacus]|uniref:non-specific protein-tyrosine kinase n=1 Tax=Blastococcus aurantiacus TaxID=1550231 RepID=A0A1G7JQ21_9ACTN|nr:polysaccharide biosynthesis tyrosine autokinase [Blastococcus aurantiacus]SDF26894.1 capsular exopolysaccharide family [Blastococcus aurantiacus]
MGARGPLTAVRRRWRWVVAASMLGLLAALVWSNGQTPTYRSTATVFFSPEYGDSASELVQGSTYTKNQVTSYARLATTPAVLLPVINELELTATPAELARSLDARVPLDTAIIELSATDPSPERSAALADAVVASLSRVVEDIAPDDDTGQATVRSLPVAAAEVPSGPVGPNLPLDLATGLVAGILLGLAAALARDALDNRVRDAGVAAELTTLPVVGSIPTRSRRGAPPIVVEADPHASEAESFRMLRTNLQFLAVPSDGAGSREARVIAVTSSLQGEGKSTVAANLAASLAETGDRVLLVDADLRRPAVARLLGIEGAVGLTDVLIGRASAADVVQDWGSRGLQVLASGRTPPNPAELLGSPAMRALLAELRADYDFVVVDTAPLLPVADAAILSRAVDGMLVLANVTRVRRSQLAESLQTLEQVKGRVLGLVLNQVSRPDDVYAYRQTGEERSSGPAPDAVPLPVMPAVRSLKPVKAVGRGGR